MTRPNDPPATRAVSDQAEAPRPIPRVPLALAIAGGLTIGLALAARQFGAPGVVLGLAGATLVACIAAFWASVRTMIGEARISGADAFAIGNTGGAQEQKRAVLRALKDLEFERAVGKISEEDFKVLVARYRNEAKRLLKQIDEASAEQRARAEELVNKRLETLGLLPPTDAPATPAFETAAPTAAPGNEDEDESEDDEGEDETDEDAKADGAKADEDAEAGADEDDERDSVKPQKTEARDDA